MATLTHFPIYHSFSSHKLLFSSPIHLQSSHKCHYSTILACSLIKPARGNRKVKSNVDLCNEIREFLSSVGLPDNHVPSTKELSQHGRQDLANIVRRRGYKFIRQLLETSSTENFVGSNIDTVQTGKSDMLGSKGQNEELKVLSDDVMANEGVQDEDFNGFKHQGVFALESSTLSLHEKAAKFIRDGKLDATEDISFGIPNEKHDIESEDTHEQELAASDADTINDDVSSSDEIKRLKFLLQQKELELTQLKQQIEKEKLALSTLQTKAETEITKARKLISEKEIELHAAEETLSGLKEVEIQYSGTGETVELAGSFNGWHHKIKMDLQPSSSITNPSESRTSRLWKAVLWLYPGVYEIKFVIDGHWVVDPQRESVTRDSVHNNILRVD